MTEKEKIAMEKVIENESVCWGMVSKLGGVDETPFMEVDSPAFETKIRISMEEAENDFEIKTLLPLLGRNVPFLVIGYDETLDRILASRKQAQVKQRENMIQDLIGGKVLHGEIVNMQPYGAYIETSGISGLLKNTDYMNASLPISEFLHEGDKIDVICKHISSGGQIQWEPAVKPNPCELKFDVEPNTVVLGTVINLQHFASGGTGVFIRIERGLDVLCLQPPEWELYPNDKVSVKIMSVEPGKQEGYAPRVKGKLLRRL